MSPSLIYAEMLTGAILLRSWVDNPQLLSGHRGGDSVVYKIHCFTLILSDLWLLQSSKMVSELCGKGV